MSRFSPTEYAEAERRRHHRSTAMLVAIMAVTITAATIVGATPSREEGAEKQLSTETGESLVVEEEKDFTSKTELERLSKYALAIKDSVPQDNPSVVAEFVEELDALAIQLAGAELSTDDTNKIQQSLNSLEPRIALLRQQPIGKDDNFAIRLDATRTELEEQAVIAAIVTVQEQYAKDVRKARLDLRDMQDKSAALGQQIASAEREQTQLRAKKARANALQPHMADVRNYLNPFISPGYVQPNSSTNPTANKRTVDALPVSLSKLEKLGALERTMEGYERLYAFGGGNGPGPNNDRPLKSFPEYFAYHIKKPEVRTIVERAQKLLREHGQALVEARMLSP